MDYSGYTNLSIQGGAAMHQPPTSWLGCRVMMPMMHGPLLTLSLDLGFIFFVYSIKINIISSLASFPILYPLARCS
jgi:hypothetical protein